MLVLGGELLSRLQVHDSDPLSNARMNSFRWLLFAFEHMNLRFGIVPLFSATICATSSGKIGFNICQHTGTVDYVAPLLVNHWL